MDRKFGHTIRNKWNLDNDIAFLNNGSFGAAPKIVIDEFESINRQIEKEPLEFFLRRYPILIRNTASLLAKFVGTKPDNLVFVENATSGANAILRSLKNIFNTQDEIIFFDHIYPAIRNAIRFICKESGATYKEIKIPYPLIYQEQIIYSFKQNLKSTTKLVVVDHIASSTSLVFPIKEIISLCRNNGTLILIDGAHIPGMIDLNIEALDPDFYVGNCHKWLFSPKGTAFLYSKPELQELIHPLVISLGYEKGFTQEFDWIGTRNPSSWLSVPKALEFYFSFGKKELQDYIHNLAITAANLLIEELKIPMKINGNQYGAMVSFPIENSKILNEINPLELRNTFYDKYKIEIPFNIFNDKILFRISSQIYNEITDYEKLIIPLKKEFFN